jgi:hypothetical protein
MACTGQRRVGPRSGERTKPGVLTPGMDKKNNTALTRRFVLVLVVVLVLESGHPRVMECGSVGVLRQVRKSIRLGGLEMLKGRQSGAQVIRQQTKREANNLSAALSGRVHECRLPGVKTPG